MKRRDEIEDGIVAASIAGVVKKYMCAGTGDEMLRVVVSIWSSAINLTFTNTSLGIYLRANTEGYLSICS